MENETTNIRNLRFLNRRGHSLAGCLHIASTPSSPVLIMVHGFACDKNEKGLFVSAAEEAGYYGYSVFRYDWRGLGDSEGDFSKTRLTDHVEDFQDALAYIGSYKGIDPERIGVIGFSLGATVAVMGFTNRIKSMVLWSPALFPEKDMWPRYNRKEIFEEINTKGYFIKDGQKVGLGILHDLRDCNLVPFIENINCSTLLIHSREDERIRVDSSIAGRNYFRTKSDIKIIAGASHSFKPELTYRPIVFESTRYWFDSCLKSNSNYNWTSLISTK